MAIKITKEKVDELAKGEKDQLFWDDKLTGFGVKVTTAGAKVYVYQYRMGGRGTKTRRYTIGKHGNVTADQARGIAKGLMAQVVRGIDPKDAEDEAEAAKAEAKRLADERARLEGDLAFSRLAPVFLDWYENDKERRPSSVRLARLVVDSYLAPALGNKPVPHITRDDLQPILDAVPSKKRGMRRAVFAYASTLFSWAAKERGIIAENPLRVMAKPDAPKARDRVLDDGELVTLWRASATVVKPFDAFFRLLVLTAQRRSEVAGMMWGELDREGRAWVIPAKRAKNKAAHFVPLSPAVVAELDALALAAQVKAKAEKPDATQWPKTGPVLSTNGRTPISGFTKVKAALDLAMGKARTAAGQPEIDQWRIHDLRRTVATAFQRLGVRFEVTEAVLNHVSGAKSGVAGIYQRHDWAAEKRSALDTWAQHVAAIIAGEVQKDNVVQLRAGGAA